MVSQQVSKSLLDRFPVFEKVEIDESKKVISLHVWVRKIGSNINGVVDDVKGFLNRKYNYTEDDYNVIPVVEEESNKQTLEIDPNTYNEVLNSMYKLQPSHKSIYSLKVIDNGSHEIAFIKYPYTDEYGNSYDKWIPITYDGMWLPLLLWELDSTASVYREAVNGNSLDLKKLHLYIDAHKKQCIRANEIAGHYVDHPNGNGLAEFPTHGGLVAVRTSQTIKGDLSTYEYYYPQSLKIAN